MSGFDENIYLNKEFITNTGERFKVIGITKPYGDSYKIQNIVGNFYNFKKQMCMCTVRVHLDVINGYITPV